MSTAHFDSIAFRVIADGGRLPEPVTDTDGLRTYTASLRVSKTNAAALAAKQSRITVKPALGFASGGNVVIAGGVGSKTLVLPVGSDDYQEWSAILVEWEGRPHIDNDAEVRVDARWQLLNQVLG